MSTTLDVERAINKRYSQAAQVREETLCCPVSYDPKYLNVVPDEIKERDYGCGDPSQFVREGDTVLDLGSGGGKICYIAAQVVGPEGFVIGVDANDEMLALAEKYRQQIGDEIGYHNVEFRKGRIQDLRLDLKLVDSYLAENPVCSTTDLASFDAYCARVKEERPLVADESIDVVLSNCVLN
ncbi:MAG: methyltransferase domain-containing protein, partial [Acidobacteria bacterium]|nr:methyltransferase domain-containing protein [Acidobacteriota bacterium]